MVFEMKNLTDLFGRHITITKVICITLLFSPLWGVWWFNIDPLQFGGVFPTLRETIVFSSIQAAVVYTLVCLLAFASFVLVPFIRPAVIRVPLMLILLIGWAFELSILDIDGTLSNQNLLWILWEERALASEALDVYATYIRDCAVVVILGIALCASPSRRCSVSGLFGLLPVVSGLLVTGVAVYTKGGTQNFPIPFGTFSNVGIVLTHTSSNASAGVKPLFSDPGSRDVLINHSGNVGGTVHPIFNKIVMIMDESVRGDYLSLNDAARNATPLLKTTDHLVNFGVAISGGNCSIISRMIFRFGMRRSNLPSGWREDLNSTFWQFAHRSGYRTVHIDAWNGPLTFRNGLSQAEKALIDTNINIMEATSYLRDQIIVDKLLYELKDDRPAFIYVDKYGVHFPYSDKYPPDFHAHTSSGKSDLALKSDNAFVGAIGSFLKNVLLIPGSNVASSREIDNYENAIAWSVDEFFRKLLRAVDLSKTLIVYTSDHGQNLLPGYVTHCHGAPRALPGEVNVPLFAITSVPEFERRLEKGAANGFGRFSHFEVFPTLLLAMGYNEDWVTRTYGPSLMDLPTPDRQFMVGSPGFQPMMIPADRNFTSTALSEPH